MADLLNDIRTEVVINVFSYLPSVNLKDAGETHAAVIYQKIKGD